MSIKSLYPDINPTIRYNIANSRKLEPKLTFHRSTSSTYVGDDGIIRTAYTNQPALEHQIDRRANFVNYSDYRLNPSVNWSNVFPTHATVTDNIDDPEGGYNAVRLTNLNTGSALFRVTFHSVKPVPGTHKWNVSFYVRLVSGTLNNTTLRSDVNDISSYIYEDDLIQGEWVRVSYSFDQNTSSNPSLTFIDVMSNSQNDYVLDFWGLQLELGEEPTKLITTVGLPKFVNEIRSVGLTANRERSNLCINSTSSSNWGTPYQLTKSASPNVISPTGATDAYTWTEQANPGTHLNNGPTINITANSSRNISCFFHYSLNGVGNERSYFLQWYKSGGETQKVTFNPYTGTHTVTSSGGASNPTNVKIEYFPNEWARLSFTGTLNETSALAIVGVASTAGDASFTGNTAYKHSFWGLQYSSSPFVEPLIPTSGSAVTYVGDNALFKDEPIPNRPNQFDGVFNQDQGSYLVDVRLQEFQREQYTLYGRFFESAAGSAGGDQRHAIYLNPNSDDDMYRYRINNGSGVNIFLQSFDDDNGSRPRNTRMGLSYAFDNYSTVGNGYSVVTQLTDVADHGTDIDRIFIGKQCQNTGAQSYGGISNFYYYPNKISDFHLKQLSNQL